MNHSTNMCWSLPHAFFSILWGEKLGKLYPQKNNKVSQNWQLKNRFDEMFFKKNFAKNNRKNVIKYTYYLDLS
jgi:hypothetical protein